MGKWLFVVLGGVIIIFITLLKVSFDLIPSFLTPFAIVIYAVTILYMIRS